MSVSNIRKGMEAQGKGYKGCAGNPNNGGEHAIDPSIENYDQEKGIIDNSHHAINRGKKGK